MRNVLSGWTAIPALSLVLGFVVTVQSQIVINEIMYHPEEPWPAWLPHKITNDTEYVEIFNAGTVTVHLADYRFDNGISYRFAPGTYLAPGAFLVVCRNKTEFSKHYPGVTNVVGNFDGNLANGGERVTLSRFDGRNWVVEDTIRYIDGGPADGHGPSLELIHPGFARLRNQYYGDWAPSIATNGTPGTTNSVYNPAPLPVVGDVRHSPSLPPPGSAVLVTCRATGRDGDALNVSLNYRISSMSPQPWEQISMRDDGAAGDATAHDGVYSVYVPPPGAAPFPSGTVLEFTITATDANGSRTFPATNTAGAVFGPFVYLCYFGEDTYFDCPPPGYPGEYPTYRILMTVSNKTWQETSKYLFDERMIDCTLIAPDGEIFYNCGLRLRGSDTRNRLLGSYRVELPRGRQVAGYGDINFNYDNAFNQYLGMTIMARAGYGCHASDVELCRLWINSELKRPSHDLYVRIEKFDGDMIEKKGYPEPIGNLYVADGITSADDNDPPEFRKADHTGDLQAYSTLSAYMSKYIAETNNPYTVWHSLSNLCGILAQDASTYPTDLPRRLNVRQWARHYATMVCLDNREAGIGCPYYVTGDELRIYCDPADGQFDIFPWDFSDVLESAGSPVWTWSHAVITKLLFNPPVLPYYAGDCLDVIENVMSPANMAAIIDGMGSKAASRKATWLNTIGTQRNGIRSKISTNFTVRIDGQPVLTASVLAPALPVATPYLVEDVNQDTNGWVYLGTFEFMAITSEYVRVTVDNEAPNRPTVADAVLFSNATAQVFIDNTTTGKFTTTGAWVQDAGGHGGNYLRSTNVGATATWRPMLTATGRYAVYAYCHTPLVAGRVWPDNKADYAVVPYQIHPSVSFSGTAPQAYTARILVNNVQAVWDLRANSWTTAANVILMEEVNRVTVSALDPDNRILCSTNFTVVAFRTPQRKTGTITSNTVWSSQDGTILVDGQVTVTAPARLTITSGTVVVFGPSGKLSVPSGKLEIAGDAAAPVYLFPSNALLPWTIECTGTGVITARYAIASGGRFSAGSGGTLSLADSLLTDYVDPQGILAATNAVVSVQRCVFSNFWKTSFTSSLVLVEESLFDGVREAGLEFSGSSPSVVVRRTTVQNSTGTNVVDGIRFRGVTGGVVTNCLLHHLSGTGVAVSNSALTVCRSLFHGNGIGLQVSVASTVTNFNNTITGCATGLVGSPASWNLIIWSNRVSVTNGPANIAHSDIEMPGTNLYPGVTNMNRNPWFRDITENDYQLRDISPCRNAGNDGADMGAAFPSGANPEPPTDFIVTNIGAGQVELRWRDNSSDEEGFEIQVATGQSGWTTITNVPPDTTNCMIYGLATGTEHQFRIRAFHRRGRSPFCQPVEIATLRPQTTEDLIAYLRITEIFYNQPGDDVAEFIELKNVGIAPLDLSGCYFDAGRFVFTNGTTLGPGQFFLLVANTNGFKATYPGVTYQGVFQNGRGLDNGGETIWIKDPGGNAIFSVTYDDVPPWPVAADGGGYSLVLVNETEPGPYDAARWRASTFPFGSPGSNDPSAPYGTIFINEVLSHQDVDNPGDWIELYNAGTNDVDIGHWYLSDSPHNLTKFRIPPGTLLRAGSYTTYTEHSHFGTNVLGTNGFALSELGEAVYLSSATSNSLTGYRTYVTFGAAENGVTFGRYMRSNGKADFTALTYPTPGSSNAYPKVGPVVINEIMYNPYRGGNEFIELYNVTSHAVPLYHPTNAWITWRLGTGIDYTFPPGESLGPHEYALVVGIDPETFRQKFGLSAALKIYGPFQGDLNNAGETVDLYKPDNQDLDGYVPYVLVDRVEYDDDPPWPKEADNGGPSLERRDPTKYGNDPINWIAVTMGGTPGASNNVAGLPSVGFVDPNLTVYETNKTFMILVGISPAVAETVTVQYVISGGTASPGADYELFAGTIVFWPYDSVQAIPLQIKDDADPEPDETIEISLFDLSANARMGGNRVFTCRIIDTDAASLPPPIINPPGTNQFVNSIVVSITPTVSNATIRYTLDGRRPSASDPVYQAPIVLTQSARLTARTFLGSYNAGEYTSALFLEQAPFAPGVWESRVAASSDDAEEYGIRRTVTLTNATVSLGLSDGYAAGFRFAGVNIPQGAWVVNAYVEFIAAATRTGSVSVSISAQATNNAATFSATASNIFIRPLTTNSVVWMPSAWTVNEAVRTPDIRTVLQEIVSRSDWAASNAVAIIITYNSSSDIRPARTFDASPSQAPLLHVEWTVPQYWLGVVTNGPGVVVGGNCWVPAGSNITIVASPAQHYLFAGWSGDTGSANTNDPALTLIMDRERWVTANFVEKRVSCGVPEWWLAQFYSTNDFEAVAAADTDGDGLTGCQEFYAGTDPTNPASVLKLTEITALSDAVSLSWLSVTSRIYSVYQSVNLNYAWPTQALTSRMPGSLSGTSTYINPLTNAGPAFFRIGVSLP